MSILPGSHMAPPRKHHKKSRTGCLTCKTRRIKCDEQRPSCENCLRRQRPCSYAQPAPTRPESPVSSHSATVARSNEDATSADHSQAQSLQSLLLQLPGFSPSPESYPGISRSQELYLMHHYATATWASLANTDSPEEIKLWRTSIPREGIKHGFLMDSLLALSSLHLAHLEPPSSQSYTSIAVEYQGYSLLGFKSALNHINSENANALFASSIIIMILAFAISVTGPEDPDSTPSERLQSIVKLLRGVGVVTSASEESIRSGMFKILLRPEGGPASSHDFLCEHELQGAMTKLIERAKESAKYVSPVQNQLYISCIQSLQNSFRHVSMYGNIAMAIAWPVMISNKLVELLQQKDPMAQLIWIYYGVLLLNVHQRWWGKGFGVRLIDSLSDSLHSVDEEWATYTQWARDSAKAAQASCRGADSPQEQGPECTTTWKA